MSSIVPFIIDTSSNGTTVISSNGSSFFKKKRPFANNKSSADNPPISFGSSPALSSLLTPDSNRPSTALKRDYQSSSYTSTNNSASHSRRESSISSLTELRTNIRRRSASLRSRRGGASGGDDQELPPSLMNNNLAAPVASATRPPEKSTRSASSTGIRPSLTVSTAPSRQKSSDNLASSIDRPSTSAASSAVEYRSGRLGFAHQTSRREEGLRPPNISHPSYNSHSSSQSVEGDVKSGSSSNATSSNSHNPRVIHQHIQDMASKRISTLDYLRKAHEGRVFWFNTLLFQKADLAKMPYFEGRKVARRATNYLLLGISLPAMLDPNSDNAVDYLRAFNAVLSEFETYQTIHPPDGTAGSGLSRARIPQMFKRSAPSKGRRSTNTTASSVAETSHSGNSNYGVLSPQESSNESGRAGPGSLGSAAASYSSVPEQELLPGEEYTFLLTPSLPFDPDYFETFATLCDVLIDCYTKVMGLVNTPDACNQALGDLFAKADTRVRKILVTGIAREFEDTSKQGIKSELAGVGKMALGGLM